jgi:hypothetical protein
MDLCIFSYLEQGIMTGLAADNNYLWVRCQVADFYGGPLFEAGSTKSTGDDYNGTGEGGIVRLLGEVKQGLCRPRAILFKFLGDSVGLQSRLLMVFLRNLLFIFAGGC